MLGEKDPGDDKMMRYINEKYGHEGIYGSGWGGGWGSDYDDGSWDDRC